ncbi:MAG: YicC/YloC family endoribonuclease [Myxococcota bacterium]|nr:YicC/YloC family endoribonuclease [Myxococcota bacterium]
MNSMTGYGRGEASNGDVGVTIELKSVNNRHRDIQVRAPREYLSLEPRIHKALKEAVSRGRIDVHVRRVATGSGRTVAADPILAEQVLEAMTQVAKRLQRLEETIPLETILAQPGVLSFQDGTTDGLTEWDVVSTALGAAIGELLEMRATEGAALDEDLKSHLYVMERLRAQVESHADDINLRLLKRMQKRIDRLVGERADPARLAQEAAILADKADVSEELARVRSHCEQFGKTLESTVPVGRKLDFLCQELNREINTIGSKAAETSMAIRVVDMKTCLERMREQVANVE